MLAHTPGSNKASVSSLLPNDDYYSDSDAERTLSRALGCYWRNFVHTADPNTPPPSSEPISAPCAHQPFAWPPFEAGPNEATMVLDTVGFAPTFGLKQEICDAFAGGGLL